MWKARLQFELLPRRLAQNHFAANLPSLINEDAWISWYFHKFDCNLFIVLFAKYSNPRRLTLRGYISACKRICKKRNSQVIQFASNAMLGILNLRQMQLSYPRNIILVYPDVEELICQSTLKTSDSHIDRILHRSILILRESYIAWFFYEAIYQSIDSRVVKSAANAIPKQWNSGKCNFKGA